VKLPRTGVAGVLIAPLLMVFGLIAVCGMAGAAAEELTELKDGPGHDLTLGRCIVCHSVEYIPSNAPAMNRTAWEKTIQKMRERFGAQITDEEAKQILDYLDANYSAKSS
jgi:sulfite dehydrogenase (cytochrome) subunit B